MTARNPFFTLEEVAPAVYAALSIPGGGSGSNAGIIDLGDQTLIFDTFLTPQAAQVLRQQAEQLTGRPVTQVINSHYHMDHILGNQVFGKTIPLIATSKTRELMIADEPNESIREEIDTEIAAQEAALASETDEAKREALSSSLNETRLLAEALASLEYTLPSLLFEEKLVFQGSRRRAELLTYGGGHTGSDAFLYLPEERLIFMGDLLFSEIHPLLIWGEPREWSRILDRIKELDAQTFVPGHGPISQGETLTQLQQYIAETLTLAKRLNEQGSTAEQASVGELSETFANWRSGMFAPNMEFLLEYVKD